ncbi:MAG TPA: alpha/beta hydrolase [Steroidobacteraceae bacterium]|nr:alpha/beta hydrolase [Steroidobacteraceae bacterium]
MGIAPLRILAALSIVSLLAGCASPVARIEAQAERAGFERSVIKGTAYRHVVFDNGIHDRQRPLAVYLEGDGTPYHARYAIAADPTSRRPLMLELMGSETGPAVYVGRPCYLGLAQDARCTATDWTVGRFGPEIVASLVAVIDRLAEERGDVRVELFGHSGGGALAVLIARQLQRVEGVITLAGNLDPQGWTRWHRYAPLVDSLDPLDGGPLPARIRQLHAAGADDRNVPPAMIEAAARRLGAPGALILPGVEHNAGWRDHWPTLRAMGDDTAGPQRNSYRTPIVNSP